MSVPNIVAAAVSLLPVKVQDKAKGIVGLLLSLASVVSLVVPGVPAWVSIAVAIATAPAVYFTPNLGYAEQPARPTHSGRILGKAFKG